MKSWILDIKNKTKDMDMPHTIEYIANYYWYHILLFILFLTISGIFIYHIFLGNTEKDFNCVIVNQEIDYDRDKQLANDFATFTNQNSNKISIDSDYVFSYDNVKYESANESSYEKFFFNWSAGEIDAMIIPSSFYTHCKNLGGEFLFEEIPIKNTILAKYFKTDDEDYFLLFPSNTKHVNECNLFLNMATKGENYAQAKH